MLPTPIRRCEAVRALGALVELRGEEVVIRGTGLREAREPEATIDVGNAGTLLRLLPGWLAAQEGRSFTLDGDESIRRRPVDRIAEPLRADGSPAERPQGRFTPLRRARQPPTGDLLRPAGGQRADQVVRAAGGAGGRRRDDAV